MTLANGLADLVRETEQLADMLDEEGIDYDAPATVYLRRVAQDARDALSSAIGNELPTPAYLSS